MANSEIRDLIFIHRLRHYEVSGKLGISECTLSRWLRTEMTPARKEQVLRAVNELIGKTREI